VSAAPPRAPLLSRALAFPCAAFAAFGAGQLWAGGASSRQLLDELGIKLPLLTELVYDAPLGAALWLLLLALGVLAGAHLGAPRGWSERAARALGGASQAGAALVVCLTGAVLAAYPLAFSTLHCALQK